MDPPGYKLADGKLRDHGMPWEASRRRGLYHIDVVIRNVLCVTLNLLNIPKAPKLLETLFVVDRIVDNND